MIANAADKFWRGFGGPRKRRENIVLKSNSLFERFFSQTVPALSAEEFQDLLLGSVSKNLKLEIGQVPSRLRQKLSALIMGKK